MNSTFKKVARCAIYTRKSTEHNLDLEFNSLDAQREACEAYIRSQAHEGWQLLAQHYDDGGLSGASLDRPALQALLCEIESGRVDIVVVYKVDRLTRSLADFAKLVEVFDRHEASFVSITQSFNTTTSMGRLTLNMLLSFAQFEREVIGERVRDKIAASKRKGLWVGGPISLGYASVNKKLAVLPKEAETVRLIFNQYLELGSVKALCRELDRRGIHSKKRILASGQTVGGGRFGVGALSHLLKNRCYIGEVVYRGEVHRGDQEPIVDRELFDAVQQRLASNSVERELRIRTSPALLTGRIFDEQGNRMTPTHTRKKSGVRYRYYLSQAVVQGKAKPAGLVTRVPAPEIEALVIQAARDHLMPAIIGSANCSEGELIAKYVDRVTVGPSQVRIAFARSARSPDLMEGELEDRVAPEGTEIIVPWDCRVTGSAKGVIHEPSPMRRVGHGNTGLLAAIGKARLWLEELVTGSALSMGHIAEREGKVERHIRLLLPLAFVPPSLIRLIADGSHTGPSTVTGIARGISDRWSL